MTIKLFDWRDKKIEVDIGDIDQIEKMSIEVISGDEVLTVVYKDCSVKKFDSSMDRTTDWYDHEYEIYNVTTGVNMLTNEEFINRGFSYWYEYM